MGSNIDPKKFKMWILNNNWQFISSKGEEKYKYILSNENGYDFYVKIATISFHRQKGQGMNEHDLKRVANFMNITKKELLKCVRESKNFTLKELHFRYSINKNSAHRINHNLYKPLS